VISSAGQDAAAKSAGSAPITDAIRAKSQTAVDAITAG
jgi:phosphate transport system substrate-binding protein